MIRVMWSKRNLDVFGRHGELVCVVVVVVESVSGAVRRWSGLLFACTKSAGVEQAESPPHALAGPTPNTPCMTKEIQVRGPEI